MHGTVLAIGVEDDAHLAPLLDRFLYGDSDEYKEFLEAPETEADLRKEYEETVYDDENTKLYDPDKYGKKASEVYSTLEEFVEATHCYVRDPNQPTDGAFGELSNPDARIDWYSVGGRFSGQMVCRGTPYRPDRLITCPVCDGKRVNPDHPLYICNYCRGLGVSHSFFEPEDNPDDRLTIAEILQSGIRERRRAMAERAWDFWDAECSVMFPEKRLNDLTAEELENLNKEANRKYGKSRGYIEEKVGVEGILQLEVGEGVTREQLAIANYNHFPAGDYVQKVDDHEEWSETDNMWEVLEALPPETRVYLVDYHC